MRSQPSSPVKWPAVCAPLFILLISVLFMPTQRSQALRNTRQSEPKRKISLGSEPPKEVKIIGIRHTEDDDWYDKVELEIQNKAQSDIWFFQVRVAMPEYARNNSTPAFFLEFGKDSPLSGGIDRPNKPLIRPGERYVFRIPLEQVENFIKTYSTDRVTVPPVGRLRFELYKLYFTDGMNFIGGKRVITGPDGGVTPIQISKFEGPSSTPSPLPTTSPPAPPSSTIAPALRSAWMRSSASLHCDMFN